MTQLTNQVISKVERKKDGDGEYGPWVLYNFWLENNDKRFSYFQSGQKPVPVQGMKIGHIEYKEKVNGKYTNYEVSTLSVVEGAPGPMRIDDKVSSKGKGRDEDLISMMWKFGPSMIKLMEMEQNGCGKLAELIDIFKEGIKQLVYEQPVKEETKEETYNYPAMSQSDNMDMGYIPDDEIPF